MKRSFLFLFLVSMLFALFACSSETDISDSQPQPPSPPADPTDPVDPTPPPPPSDAIYIRNEQDLLNMAKDTANYDKYYYLANDIDLAGDQNNQWTPIGNSSDPFTGTFDGGGHSIKGIYINEEIKSHLGLFGYIYTAVIKDLGVSVDITGYSYVSGIVGYNDQSSISNCYSTGVIVARQYYAGGISGGNSGQISNCYSTADVTSPNTAGGIVGSHDGGSISDCYSTGTIKAQFHAGGIAGVSWGEVSYCYSIGDITANTNYSGGIEGGRKGSSLHHNVALNGVVCDSYDHAGRTVGYVLGSSSDNYAYEGILVGIVGSEALVGSGDAEAVHDGRHGANAAKGTASGQINNPDFWNGTGTVGFLTDIWDLNFSGRDYKLPLLKNIPLAKQPDALPDHLKLQP